MVNRHRIIVSERSPDLRIQFPDQNSGRSDGELGRFSHDAQDAAISAETSYPTRHAAQTSHFQGVVLQPNGSTVEAERAQPASSSLCMHFPFVPQSASCRSPLAHRSPGSPSGKNDLRTEEARLDRRQNPFTALRPGQPRRIADQQEAIPRDLTLRRPVKIIGVPFQSRYFKRHFSRRSQKPCERSGVLRDALRIGSPESDVQHVPLAETPSVTFHVGAEIEFRTRSLHVAMGNLMRVHFEFGFVSRHWHTSMASTRGASNGTKVSTGAYH